jgi:hypothetical protein
MGCVGGIGDHFRRVQQGLRRDAADVQTHAAQGFVTLDQRDFFAQIGGAKCGGVAAWPGT